VTTPQPENAEGRVPDYWWEPIGAVVGAMIGAGGGFGVGIGVAFAAWHWLFVPVGLIGGAIVGGLAGYFVGGSAAIAFDFYARIIGQESRVPIYVGLATGAIMLVRIMADKEATWVIGIFGFIVFWVVGYALGGIAERVIVLVRFFRSRQSDHVTELKKD